MASIDGNLPSPSPSFSDSDDSALDESVSGPSLLIPPPHAGRSVSDPSSSTLASDSATSIPTPALGSNLPPHVAGGSTPIPPALRAKMAAFAKSRGNKTPLTPHTNNVAGATAAMQGLRLGASRPDFTGSASMPNSASPSMPGGRRPKPGLKLSGILGTTAGGAGGAGLAPGRPVDQAFPKRPPQGELGTPFANFRKIVDPSGALNFGGKAVLHAKGVDFTGGSSFAINMGELVLEEELGRGNYGTVKKVLHKPTNVKMAMKEIRLELEESKLNAIMMELDILHRAVAPEIVEFYGAFFIESCVYYCMEYMDAGSLDHLQGDGVPEHVLARITGAMVRGLKFLKDELQIMHRDVKPTNVLVSKLGAIKLCDFGVSGQLEKSLAKTNIGCQSYMAPERIKGESQNNLGTYTVSSDVWSLGLSMIELAMGKYPYPPETYSNVFAQLTAIVHGPAPELPDGYSELASDFVAKCLVKEPSQRATYSELLEHEFLVQDRTRELDMAAWVAKALAHRDAAREAASIASAPPPPPPAPITNGGS